MGPGAGQSAKFVRSTRSPRIRTVGAAPRLWGTIGVLKICFIKLYGGASHAPQSPPAGAVLSFGRFARLDRAISGSSDGKLGRDRPGGGAGGPVDHDRAECGRLVAAHRCSPAEPVPGAADEPLRSVLVRRT